jgi:hypothetical protein
MGWQDVPPTNRSRAAVPAILLACPSGEDIPVCFSAGLPLLARLRPNGARWDRRQPHAQRAVPVRP